MNFRINFKLTVLLLIYSQSIFAYDASKFWGSAEYLYWWVQNSPINIPLITENNNPNAFAIINEPGTNIIFGAGSNRNTFNFNGINGARVTIGGWIDDASQYGIEVSAFDLPKVKQSYTASSVNTNLAVINIPFNSGNENVLVKRNTPNTASISNTFQSYGFEVNGIHIISNNNYFPLQAILGFRYLNIHENFLLNDTSFPTSGVVNVNDHFLTKNHFYGLQLGAKSNLNHDKFFIDLSALVAFGNNHQILKINGDTSFNNKIIQNFGIFSEPTNLGTHTNNLFAIVPELRIKLGYEYHSHIKPFLTYDGFYINHAIRPGNVIDRNINKSQNKLIGGSGILSGPALPRPQFKNSSMWMQGISAGVDFKFN